VKQHQDLIKKGKIDQKLWGTFAPSTSSSAKERQDKAELDQYLKISDAEIFAVAQQIGLEVDKEVYLLNFVSQTLVQIKAAFCANLEFRYLRLEEQGPDVFYWRDCESGRNFKVFPYLNELRQRVETIKNNILNL